MRSIRSVFSSSLPIHPPIPQRHLIDLLLELPGQLILGQPPSPVDAHGRGLVDAAFVVQSHVILDRDHAQAGAAPHDQADEGLVQVFGRGMLVAEVGPGQLLFLRRDALPPACDRLIVVGPGVGHGIFRVIVGQVVVSTAGIPGVKGEF